MSVNKDDLRFMRLGPALKDTALGEFLDRYLTVTKDQYIEPSDLIDDKEVVVDKMSDHEKILFTLQKQFVNEILDFDKNVKKQLSEKRSVEELELIYEEAVKKLQITHNNIDVAKTIFWHSIERRLPGVNIGIRRGYKIVKIPDSDQDENHKINGIHIVGVKFPDFLKDIIAMSSQEGASATIN